MPFVLLLLLELLVLALLLWSKSLSHCWSNLVVVTERISHFFKKKKHQIIMPINNITDQIKFIYKNVLTEWKYRI